MTSDTVDKIIFFGGLLFLLAVICAAVWWLLIRPDPDSIPYVPESRMVHLMTSSGKVVHQIGDGKLDVVDKTDNSNRWEILTHQDRITLGISGKMLCHDKDDIASVSSTCSIPLYIDGGVTTINEGTPYYLGINIDGKVAWLREKFDKTNIKVVDIIKA